METDNTKNLRELFSELEHCDEEDQQQKIDEMKKLIEKMDTKELLFIYTEEQFNEIGKMIEKEKLHLENVLLFLKPIGYCKALNYLYIVGFERSLLNKRLKKMIIEEEKKKEGKNEKLFVDLCECCIFLHCNYPRILLTICVPCLLNATLKKEESDKVQKEVEMALLALSCMRKYVFIEQELYISEIKEIIKYHQEHQNLTRLAYQSAWQFLISRSCIDKSLEDMIVNELHFGREASGELEELSKYVDWRRKEEENGRIEVKIIWRWLYIILDFFHSCKLWNEEWEWLIRSLVQVFRAAKDNYREIRQLCIYSLRDTVEDRAVEIDDFLKGGATDLFSEETKQSTLEDKIMWNCLNFFLNISERLKEKTHEEADEVKRKEVKKKMSEKMEEDGYEDVIISFHEVVSFRNKYYRELSKNLADYFVNV